MVLKRTVDGDMNKPFVLRYEVREDYWLTYTSSKRRDAPFYGNLEIYSISSFKGLSLETGKNGIREEPCYNYKSGDGSGGSSSGGGNGGGGYSGGDSSDNWGSWNPDGGYGSYYISWGGGGGGIGTQEIAPDVEVGQGSFDDRFGLGAKNAKTRKNGYCPEDELLVPINEEEDHVHLIDQADNPCINEIIKKLQQKDLQKLTVPDMSGLSGTGHLAQGILDLFDKSGDYDITFKIEQLGTSNGNQLNGRTRNVSGGWEIKIDSDLVNDGTKLFIAKTIIHESTHAFIQYILGTNRTSDLVKDLNEIHKTLIDANLTQHEFMSQYVDALAHSLSVWDNNAQSIDYYKKLSWGGLETSDAYKAQTNKTDIQKAIQNERYNKTGAKGTKCN